MNISDHPSRNVAIWSAPYILERRNSSGSDDVRYGTLLKFNFPDGVGYADLHPWPELGDLDLKTQLEALASGKLQTQQLKNSFLFATIDAKNRSQNLNAFAGATVPQSHFLLANTNHLHLTTLMLITEDSFRAIKIKVGRNLEQEMKCFKKISEEWPEDLAIRLDFNAIAPLNDVCAFFKSLPKNIRDKIEFVEDPISLRGLRPDQQSDLMQLLDREVGHTITWAQDFEPIIGNSSHAKVQILKPAVDIVTMQVASTNETQILTNLSKHDIVVSSYLDHPLAQTQAAYIATRLMQLAPEKIRTCGLLSHTIYQPSEFSEELVAKGPYFQIPSGVGFGFDLPLARQNWKLLSAVSCSDLSQQVGNHDGLVQ